MSPVVWVLLAQTVVTVLALVFAALAWVRVGAYMRQCRRTVQAYAPLAHAAIAQRIPEVERTQPHRVTFDDQDDDQADEPPSGRHALAACASGGMTDVAPAVGDLDDDAGELRVPPYYRAHETLTDTVPRYYFAELGR